MNPSRKAVVVFLVSIGVTLFAGCNKDVNSEQAADNLELGQQIGEAMASIDEAGGSNGILASNDTVRKGTERTFARLIPRDGHPDFFERLGIHNAEAATCVTSSTFSACSNNVITRNFGGCTIGAVTFTGSVTFTYNDAAVDSSTCQLSAVGHSIQRSPNFQATGRRHGALTVSKTGMTGQTITMDSASTFNFTSDGVRRVFANAKGKALLDFTTSTTAPIAITGAARAGRTLSGGSLRVVNNLTGVSCEFSPSSVVWAAGCNCAVSGNWVSTCSDHTGANLELTGCGTGKLTVDNVSQSLEFDRCYAI